MATLTIHNIPDDLLKKLEHSARENSRAVDEEAVIWLSSVEATEPAEQPSPEDRIRGFRKLQERYPDVHITDEQITRAKREGRHGDSEDDPYRIIPSRFADSMKPEEFIEYTDELKNKLEGKVWVTEEEVNQAKREGRLGDEATDQEPDPWLEIARKTRESMPGVYITDEEELNRFKREGRL